MPALTVKVKRFDGKKSWWQEYKVDIKSRKISVLDVLVKIKEEQDPTLAIRYSCRMAICGSCGMVINGVPRLACQTLLAEIKDDTITVEPMWNHRVIKDLVVDTEPNFEKLRKVKPYIIRDLKEIYESDMEIGQKPEELEKYYNFAYCIECGLCMAACPILATNDRFLGPMALNAAYRWSADSRDRGWEERAKIIDAEDGVWPCHLAYTCSAVCPRGVDPGFSIQLLKASLIRRAKRVL
ncbi:MAG: succinate dehydrogenase iron-sulfur subunit [Thermoproteus sp.]|jgi:succinate dehydrogenase / fumarate reductase iron-sulfur subunit|nr:succinate dehydrogenase iron-sulfur subunit [Thermoproteus sp.]MDT7882448.1 succinate dehydrogenase iron-sulfur subunit [Thermoproteus sp.]